MNLKFRKPTSNLFKISANFVFEQWKYLSSSDARDVTAKFGRAPKATRTSIAHPIGLGTEVADYKSTDILFSIPLFPLCITNLFKLQVDV